MESRRRIAVILVSGVFFLVVFVALTVVALSSAELNVATILFAAVSLFVCVAVIGALIGVLRKPPDDG